jgi:hypothetical protein
MPAAWVGEPRRKSFILSVIFGNLWILTVRTQSLVYRVVVARKCREA